MMFGLFGSGAITHKLTTRETWLLGNSPCDRIKIVDQMKKLYEAHSAVIHGSTNTSHNEFQESLLQGRKLARRALKTLLMQGSYKIETN